MDCLDMTVLAAGGRPRRRPPTTSIAKVCHTLSRLTWIPGAAITRCPPRRFAGERMDARERHRRTCHCPYRITYLTCPSAAYCFCHCDVCRPFPGPTRPGECALWPMPKRIVL